MIVHAISLSGGKDSVATALVCRELYGAESMVLLAADTGHEHPITYDYWKYLEDRLQMPIQRLKSDFAERIARKRRYVEEVWTAEDIDPVVIVRALSVLHPTGIPFLDLCIWKGRFPSRKAQFCTDELKIVPLMNYQMELIEAGNIVWSWQGIRADEGGRRRHMPEFEEVDDCLFVHRPILRWTAADTFEAMAVCDIKPNPLYLQGMLRVGCMPCINCSKAELTEIDRRWPEVIRRIHEWELCVALASKRGAASFFPAPNDGRGELQGRNIHERVLWSSTDRGGLQFNLMQELPPAACHSHYQLCE